MRRKISQDEAHRAVKRVAELQAELRNRSYWNRGVRMTSFPVQGYDLGALTGAHLMGASFAARLEGSQIIIYAVPRDIR